MKYISMQLKMLALIMAFGLTGTIQAKPHGPITHANAPEWIKKHLACDIAFAQQVTGLLMKADNIIYEFLDYKGNQEVWDTHIQKFSHVIEDIKQLHVTAKQHAHHAKAAKEIHKFQISLEKILKLIQNARAREIGLLNLGLSLKPIFESFDNELPTSMTIASKIKSNYNGKLDYLTHLDTRLKMA